MTVIADDGRRCVLIGVGDFHDGVDVASALVCEGGATNPRLTTIRNLIGHLIYKTSHFTQFFHLSLVVNDDLVVLTKTK